MTIVTPDGQLATRDVLRKLLADRSEPYALGVRVSTRDLPGSDEDRPLPYVQVKDDGPATRDSRLRLNAPQRVIAWHRDEGLAKSLIALVEGLLLGGAHGAGVRHFTSGTGPVGTTDPDNGVPMASITINARLIPHQLD